MIWHPGRVQSLYVGLLTLICNCVNHSYFCSAELIMYLIMANAVLYQAYIVSAFSLPPPSPLSRPNNRNLIPWPTNSPFIKAKQQKFNTKANKLSLSLSLVQIKLLKNEKCLNPSGKCLTFLF